MEGLVIKHYVRNRFAKTNKFPQFGKVSEFILLITNYVTIIVSIFLKN